MPKNDDALRILTREDADRALEAIGHLEGHISEAERRHNDRVADLKAELVEKCGPLNKALKRWIKVLRKWATKNKDKEFPQDARTLQLNFGKVYFKWTPYRIEFEVAEETVIERLRARGMKSCIRVKEEVNKEALEAYDDKTLKAVGAYRDRDDKFYYEVKKEEVK